MGTSRPQGSSGLQEVKAEAELLAARNAQPAADRSRSLQPDRPIVRKSPGSERLSNLTELDLRPGEQVLHERTAEGEATPSLLEAG